MLMYSLAASTNKQNVRDFSFKVKVKHQIQTTNIDYEKSMA